MNRAAPPGRPLSRLTYLRRAGKVLRSTEYVPGALTKVRPVTETARQAGAGQEFQQRIHKSQFVELKCQLPVAFYITVTRSSCANVCVHP